MTISFSVHALYACPCNWLCMYVCMCVCMYEMLFVCLFVYACVCVCTCMCVIYVLFCLYECVHFCMLIRVYILLACTFLYSTHFLHFFLSWAHSFCSIIFNLAQTWACLFLPSSLTKWLRIHGRCDKICAESTLFTGLVPFYWIVNFQS